MKGLALGKKYVNAGMYLPASALGQQQSFVSLPAQGLLTATSGHLQKI